MRLTFFPTGFRLVSDGLRRFWTEAKSIDPDRTEELVYVSMRRTILSLVLLCLWPISTAVGHELSTSYSQIRVAGTNVDIAFTINATEMHNGPQVDIDQDGRVTEAELDASFDALSRAVLDNYQVSIPGSDPIAPDSVEYTFVADNVIRIDLSYIFSEPANDLNVFSSLDEVTQPDHRHLLQIGEGSAARHTVLDQSGPLIEIDYTMGIPQWVTVWEFALLGIKHIVTGYDHLAFLVGLLLVTTTMRSLLKIVTAFTLGHSVTLALATLGVVAIPSRLIESLIALSIAYVAVENFLGRRLAHRWVITFLFGLVHGFGFSNVLQDLGLSSGRLAVSLFSFNAGVEIGQLIFVTVVFPGLYYLARSRWKEQVMSSASVIIMCMGFYWFIQRAIFG